uniref:Uncharacterized protein n=1 Tax=Anopheles dirus TaxID=7168 RepID=A0A182NWD0_9DIPT
MPTKKYCCSMLLESDVHISAEPGARGQIGTSSLYFGQMFSFGSRNPETPVASRIRCVQSFRSLNSTGNFCRLFEIFCKGMFRQPVT